MPESPYIKIYQNPWSHTFPDAEMIELFTNIAATRAQSVRLKYDINHYNRDSLAISILDPAAPLWRPSNQTLLATIAIGPEGEDFVVNAIAKAVEHRDKGRMAGYGVHVDLTQTGDGDFCYGFSTQVDETIAGASGQTELQDAYEAGMAAVEFNYWVRRMRQAWREVHPDNRWFCKVNKPDHLAAEMAEDAPTVYDSTD